MKEIHQEHLADVPRIGEFRQVELHYANSKRPGRKLTSIHDASDNMRLNVVVFREQVVVRGDMDIVIGTISFKALSLRPVEKEC